MEEETDNVEMGGSAGTSSNSRWNPTKEQISTLESLYMQGIRTPSADQIQQITARLRAYGHIEGKNVFYWFQNHKARQRQKQKQESVAYFNHFLHRSPPIFSTPLCPNVICAPYYMPQSEMGFYPHQHPKVLLSGGVCRRRSRTDDVMPSEKPKYCDVPPLYDQQGIPYDCMSNRNLETLPLFPMHPTGILEAKTIDQSSPLSSIATPDIDEQEGGQLGEQPFFDFFSAQRSS
ncbi:hypothetical protein L6164_019196 [Bauhinia variegata]|uniref:Uncharacterized protein n=1 Tax=Bauhinia variegata TaxID=167791 RepID=A0ACB9NDF2_BAUVA|nr:hypothetical protein L6164_019196 [Bauhinia variegata]